MAKKHLLLGIAALAVTLTATTSFASPSSSSHPSSSDAGAFEFKRFICERYAASNIDEDMPSLAQLYQDAVARKAHLDGFFEFVKTQGLAKTTNGPMKGLVDYFQKLRVRTAATAKMPSDLLAMALIKTDFAVERDLMTYYVKALEKLAANPTQEHIEELYAQTVYTTRLNLQSLGDRAFGELANKYPAVFDMKMLDGRLTKSMSGKAFSSIKASLTPEDKAYVDFITLLGKPNTTLHTHDTVTITKHLRELLRLPTLTSQAAIFDINSLSFYLNVERALLAACDTLQFEPEKYGFHKDPDVQTKLFALSALMNYHQKGLLHGIVSKDVAPKEMQLLKRNKDKLLGAILTDEAKGPIADMLARLGVAHGSPSKKTPKKPAKPKKGPRHTALKKIEPTLFETPASPLLFERDEIDVDTDPVLDIEEDQVAALSQESQGEALPASSTWIPLTRLIPHLDDYAYERNVAWTPHTNRATYIFNGAPFDMQGRFFDIGQLQRIKELTHHKPDSPKLPNLASGHLRLHYRVGEEAGVRDFIPNALYLSGGRRFPFEDTYHVDAHIKNAYHNVLTPSQQRTFRRTHDTEERWSLLSKHMTQQLNERVAQGPWGVNCADSEGNLLLDLDASLPLYLRELSEAAPGPLRIEGVVLGVSTYRDPCWRCRNLLQGWQRGFENALGVTIQTQNLPITLAPDLPTLVFGFGEIAPESRDFFQPRTLFEDVRLEAATEGTDPRQTHKLRLVKMVH